MKVSFRQSGGYAGLSRGCELDTDVLPTEETAHLQTLLSESGILEDSLATTGASPGNAPAYDCLNYEITVESPQGKRTLSLSDPEVTEQIAPLLGHLVERSTPQPLR